MRAACKDGQERDESEGCSLHARAYFATARPPPAQEDVVKHLSVLVCVTAMAMALSFRDISAQRAEPMTAARIRALTNDVRKAARGDKNELVIALDDRVRARWGDFETFPISLLRRDDLRITLSAPYLMYRRTLVEYLRIDRPITTVPWVDAAIITVEPSRIDAPDITQILVKRSEQDVQPSANLLRPMTFADGNGRQSIIHAGEVRFALSAFAPGAVVMVKAVPQSGEPFVAALDDAQLRTMK